MNNLPRPPAHVEPYVRILGVEGAVTFLLTYGGAELYLPLTAAAAARSEVAALLGTEATLTLAAAQLPRRVPTAKPWIAQVLRAQGLRTVEIARRLHASDVAVRRWLSRSPSPLHRTDPRQFRLF